MNIRDSNTQRFIHRSGFLEIAGHNNQIQLFNSQLIINVFGADNVFRINNCQLLFQINGNDNQFFCFDSQITLGVNGNDNKLRERDSCIYLTSCNGEDNLIEGKDGVIGSRKRNQYQHQELASQCGNQSIIPNSKKTENRHKSRYGRIIHNYGECREQQNYNIQQREERWQTQERFKMTEDNQFNNIGFYSKIKSNKQYNTNQNLQNLYHNMDYFGIRQFNSQMYQNYPSNGYGFNPNQHAIEGLSEKQLKMLPVSSHRNGETQCQICSTGIKTESRVIILLCSHRFHQECARKQLFKHSVCPLCQSDVIIREQSENFIY